MSVTYKQHTSIMYNLTLDTRELGDIKTISREQMKRGSFARDQGLAAHASGIDKSEFISEAARSSSILRNLHPHMGNTDTTGGCGGLGYATARMGVPTKDPVYLSDADTVNCFSYTNQIANTTDYILLSQIICKPCSPIYSRLIAELCPVGSNTWEDVRKKAYHFTVSAYTATGTVFTGIVGGELGGADSPEVPVKLEPSTTYWFARFYNKVSKAYEIHWMDYAARPLPLFKGGSRTCNFPNVPLSRSNPYSQAYYDANKGEIAKYPPTAELDAYMLAIQAELDDIASQTQVQEGFIQVAQDAVQGLLTPLASLSETRQVEVLDYYLSDIRPTLLELGLALDSYTQIELDDLRAAAEVDEVANARVLQLLVIMENNHNDLAIELTDIDIIEVNHALAEAVPYSLSEENAVTAIAALQLRKSVLLAGAPKSDLTGNAGYSKWGEDTFFQHYPRYYDNLYETFMSEGHPQHDATRRFLAMIGQNPRTISDVVRGAVQTEAAEGDMATLCDQLTFGCQITSTSDYAEMRYAVEFIKSAWWRTMGDEPNTASIQYMAEDFESSAGRSAWSNQHVEETMLSPGEDTLKTVRTRWASCEVWIEENELGYGAFGAVKVTEEEEVMPRPSVLDATAHPLAPDPRVTGTPELEELSTWRGKPSIEQTLEGTYNIAEGLVLKVRMRGLCTQAFGKVGRNRWAVSTGIEYPVIPLLADVLSNIPQMQMCQMQNEFMFIRSHVGWKQKKSNWVNFRDNTLVPSLGFILTIVGLILAIPSGGLTLTWAAVGTALMYAAIGYATMRVITHFLKQWGLDKTWIGAVIAFVVAVVGVYFGMPVTDAALLGVTMSADSMARAYKEVNIAEAKESAGILAKLDDAQDALNLQLDELDAQQNWLDFYDASDLVKMRQAAVDYVRTETPDKYYERILGYQSNMLSLDGLDYLYDHGLDLELS